jgi:bifunctional non-homologous end joining protein LigD
MALKKYREKRKFGETPEPEGGEGSASGSLRFVVQKHQARRLHYDFRLELEGVLKSWALPKGPPLDPKDRRLAVMVEDHPLEYGNFEGTIPRGNYGAGTVMVWDAGVFHSPETSDRAETERLLKAGLQKGHLAIVLRGRKLQGGFDLVKLKKGEENAWLLLKRADQFATQADVTAEDRSVLSNRTLEEITAAVPGTVPAHLKVKPPDLQGALKSEMLRNLKPMLPILLRRPFDRAGWLFEIKWDGYRAMAEVEEGQVRLYSRNLLSLEERFAPVVQSLRQLGHRAVLDGELVVVDDTGKANFEWLQNYPRSGNGQLVYYLFDILFLDGYDLCPLPLRKRKEILERVLPPLPHLRLSEHLADRGVGFFEAARERGLEGIVAKDGESRYQPGRRSPSWFKVKTHFRQEAVIGGFTEPRGGRTDFGALLLGAYQGRELRFVGQVGSGFTGKSLAEVRARLAPLVQKVCPFETRPHPDSPAQWVKPQLVCEVKFQNWTGEGIMRQPVFLGLREDKSAPEVKVELPASPPPVRAAVAPAESVSKNQPPSALRRPSGAEAGEAAHSGRSRAADVGGSASPTNQEAQSLSNSCSGSESGAGTLPFRPTNLKKVFWPKEKYSKGDLLDYYRRVAPFILPYLKDRPQSLHRHPDGITGKSFYQKNFRDGPAWIKTVKAGSGSGRKEIEYLLCQDEASLLYLANLGCIELNPWSSRLGTLDRPDFVVIDLDPRESPFAHLVEAAVETRRVLDLAGAEGYLKTSGKTGLHVYVPLGARYRYEEAARFAEILVRLIHFALPHTTSLERSPKKRIGRVYLDHLQNRQGQTVAAPYSVRPRPGATVSTPLRWEELKGLDPSRFTIRSLPRRLEKVGDLWRPVLGPGVDLAGSLDRLLRAAGGLGN